MHTTDTPPDHAEPEIVYDLSPFNDALALLDKTNKDTSRQNTILKWVGIPAITIAIALAAFNGIKPDHTYVKTLTVYCLLNNHGNSERRINLAQPPACDETTVNVADLLPITSDSEVQVMIAQQLLPVIVRKAFSITTPDATTDDIRDLVVPFLQKNSAAYVYFTNYYKDNKVATLAKSQSNSVAVDPIPRPQTPGEYIVGYTVTASNGTQTTSNHFLAKVNVLFGPPTGVNTAGLYIYSFSIDSVQNASTPQGQ
jgi:hypothetical protein